ncbi:oligosaccharide flippase family protein [Dyella sp. LX-66]|uniref:lipopolysaccharide biosynthesis protein n=1 Tax=unclassified Dyella TaxID=2634549 RepID=UPI001BE02ED5|nr:MULTISPECIES: oligosaccharide flippase family protein [unclassified Dyella]MBT2118817.1 oligosaccharide flippase family protein [Dyella sp. LX-1]MBT2141166.1 oligosaccharide flippase family protein [Dyella sp. LX-66]
MASIPLGKLAALISFRGGSLARSSLTVMAWSAGRLGAQLAWVLLLARALGASSYGLFSGLAALALAMSGFVGLGLGLRMYQDAARDPQMLNERWRQASLFTAITGVALAALYLLVAREIYATAGGSLLLAIAISELVWAPWVTQVAYAYAARGWMGYASAAPVVLSMARVTAVLLLYLLPSGVSIDTYAWLHGLLTAAASLLLILDSRRRLSIESAGSGVRWSDIRSGLGFSAMQASTLALSTLDKSFALLWGGEALAGRYVAANRFVSVAALPVDAMVTAALPRLFRAVDKPATAVRALSLLALGAGGYGAVMGGVVWLGSGLVPWLLGPSFAESAVAVRLLALYVPLYCLRILGTNALLGLGWKNWRFFSELLAVGAMGAGIAWRAPVAGLEGVVEVVLGAEALLGALVWGRVVYGMTRRIKRSA